ncbi:hypothetical protein [Corynebacterium phocae]|uniref:hypothetical protein n=1 Tax=Corynebacterium phocae TaxID=161895 RepID=UPI001B80C3C1|nr:hypothetical protein [Corynebacterium phocae]
MKSIAGTLVMALALSVTSAPGALAQESFSTSAHSCVATNEGEPIQIPYAAIESAEDLIADGTIDPELVAALEYVDINYEVVGPQPRVLPAVAAAAVAAVLKVRNFG